MISRGVREILDSISRSPRKRGWLLLLFSAIVVAIIVSTSTAFAQNDGGQSATSTSQNCAQNASQSGDDQTTDATCSGNQVANPDNSIVGMSDQNETQTGEGPGGGQNSSPQGNTNQEGTGQNADSQTDTDQGGTAQSSGQNGNPQGTAATQNRLQNRYPKTNAQSDHNRGQAATTNKLPTEDADAHPEQPKEVQQPNPYGDLPSLHDLYTQIPFAGGKLRRFGSEAFILGSGNIDQLPMDLPVGPEYVLGSGDYLIVNMWGGHSERLRVTIDRQGQISLPEAGTITLDGLTIAQAQNAIQKTLSTQFQDEHVEISLGRLRTVRIYVVGDVQRPGAYDVSSLSTPLNALYAAGGPTSQGSLRILRQYRGTELVRQFDLYDFLLHGVRSNLDRLLPGDTILVPPVGAQVTVEGMVHRPAIYELNGEQTLDQVLDLAGGLLPTANLKQINVGRVEANDHRSMISLQLPDNPEEMKKDLIGFHVQAEDDIVISKILPYNQQAVYLEGHVFRPGKYAYHEGMTINDLLHSYRDVMPEPADHAELIRLQPPDYRPETISISLPEVLMGNNPIMLQPFDLIHIYSRYEIDSPSVSIEGQVLRPGSYPLSQGMTATDLVRMAGDFTRSAYREVAGLSSYEVENGQKVLINHSVIALQKALDGDKNSDVILKPGDVVSVDQLAGWQDIGSSITITGEVEHAGHYGIDLGERLSSVLKRAGGFREGAYPAAAILERTQVRVLGEQARQQMIQRIETTPIEANRGITSTSPQTGTDSQLTVLEQQRDRILAELRSHPASGRLVINISPDINRWQNTSADIVLRAGDTLFIPKKPDFVLVSGQVYNATAISYVPGRGIDWYLKKAGGATPYGNKRDIYVLRADGSVVAHGSSWLYGSSMNTHMKPGDTVFVPEKSAGGSLIWQNIIGLAQIVTAAALPLAISGVF